MSTFSTLLSSPLAHAIGWALVHLLWQGVLVAAILAASLALMQKRNANARYLAACGALVLLLALGAGTAVHAYQPALPEAPPAYAATLDGLKPVLPASEMMTAAVTESPAGWRDALASAAVFANNHLSQFVLVWMLGVL